VISKHFAKRDLETLETQAAECEPASVVTYPLHGRGERSPSSRRKPPRASDPLISKLDQLLLTILETPDANNWEHNEL
jgi:hypothetical protein